MKQLKSSKFWGNRAFTAFIFAFSISLILTLLASIGAFSNIDKKLSNFFYKSRPISNDIIIVAIDEKTINRLGPRKDWTRTYYADVIEKINKQKPNSIFLDIAFVNGSDGVKIKDIKDFFNNTEKSQSNYKLAFDFLTANKRWSTNTADNYFVNVLKNSKNIYSIVYGTSPSTFIPIYKIFENYITKVFPYIKAPNERLYKAYTHLLLEDKNIIESPATALARKFLNAEPLSKSDIQTHSFTLHTSSKTIKIPTDSDGQMMINYAGPVNSYNTISFSDVYDQQAPKDIFKNKIVLIGVTAFEDEKDRFLTPMNNEFMSGIEAHANAIQTILDQKFLTEQSGLKLFLMLFLITGILFFTFSSFQLGEAFLMLILAYLLYIIIGKISFKMGMVVNAFYGYTSILLAYIAALMYKFFVLDSDKRILADAFGHYVSPEIVKKITENPENVKLTGEKRIITVMFTDIKGSTTMAEGVPIHLWIKQLNEYFTVMETVVKKYHGTLDKFEGDAIMAFWNAPIENPDHVLLAYKAAVEMRYRIAQLHNKWLKEGKPLIDFRVGINTGEALIGNFGSINRFNYTAMGDSVNIASRLESTANKVYGTTMAISGFEKFYPREKLKDLVLRQIDYVYLPGKNLPVVIYELVGLAKFTSKEKIDQIDLYHQGLNSYFKRDFQTAASFFKQIQNDVTATIMYNRCNTLNAGGTLESLNINQNSLGYHILNK